MVVDPPDAVIPGGPVEPGSTGSGDGLDGAQTLLPTSDAAMEEDQSDNDEEGEEANEVRWVFILHRV